MLACTTPVRPVPDYPVRTVLQEFTGTLVVATTVSDCVAPATLSLQMCLLTALQDFTGTLLVTVAVSDCVAPATLSLLMANRVRAAAVAIAASAADKGYAAATATFDPSSMTCVAASASVSAALSLYPNVAGHAYLLMYSSLSSSGVRRQAVHDTYR